MYPIFAKKELSPAGPRMAVPRAETKGAVI